MPDSKLRDATPKDDDDLVVDMSPMIDMVFLLLIFFIVNATAIIVKTDPKVAPPIADQAKPQEDGRGRIVVNVRSDGSYSAEDFNVMLPDIDAITSYVKEAKEKIEGEGLVPRLHLRGDEGALFRYSRTVIRGAANAGVDQVLFAVYQKERPKKD
jgi:biopolymer transport protein ExbD